MDHRYGERNDRIATMTIQMVQVTTISTTSGPYDDDDVGCDDYNDGH